tara:strand:+ start:1516 stop:1728 length:213 start_codon:yes stop_codon:yes gene_type:complete
MIKEAIKLKKEIDNTELTTLPVQDIVKYAPLLILALRFVKLFTGKKADAKIDEIISWLQVSIGILPIIKP